ncbi:hypothetical protein [Isoptericola sp. NPDC056134]|uniref:hypothetical protein n=1 Tax=Isoptericola sp. NPDC056134 TaxID=3345723 RepID=UPI0035E5E04E
MPLPTATGLARPSGWADLGARGLIVVLPLATLLAVGAGGDGATVVVGPLVTFSLPLLIVIALWWDDWPGSHLGPRWTAWANIAVVAAGAIVLAGVAQSIVGGLDPAGLFRAAPGPGHIPSFPATVPLGAMAFVLVLELTLVGERRPLHRLPPRLGGFAALAACWSLAVVLFLLLVDVDSPAGSLVAPRTGPLPGGFAAAALAVVGSCQVLGHVVLRGWPTSRIAGPGRRVLAAHATMLGAAAGSLAIVAPWLRDRPDRVGAVAGCVIAAGLLVGMLFDAPSRTVRQRLTAVLGTLALAALLYAVLVRIAEALRLDVVDPDMWVAHASLNALATAVLLHVAIGHRQPFAYPASGPPGPGRSGHPPAG